VQGVGVQAASAPVQVLARVVDPASERRRDVRVRAFEYLVQHQRQTFAWGQACQHVRQRVGYFGTLQLGVVRLGGRRIKRRLTGFWWRATRRSRAARRPVRRLPG